MEMERATARAQNSGFMKIYYELDPAQLFWKNSTQEYVNGPSKNFLVPSPTRQFKVYSIPKSFSAWH